MGGLLTKCKCTSTSEPPDINVDQIVDSMVMSEQVDNSHNQGLNQELNQELEPEIDFYSTNITETLNNFRFQKLFTDFTINVNGNLFPVHKNVLAASCTFFKDLFNASEDICYEMTNVEPFALEEVLNFLYIGKCRLHQQNVTSVLHVARILGLCDVQEASEKYISILENKSVISHISFVSRKDSILPAIQEFQTEGLFCDVTLTTSSGRVIPVHKNILTAVSCYFQGLFRSDMREVHECNVDLEIIDESVLGELLSFIYSGKISVTFDNVRSLLQASDYLLMESLKTTIDQFLKDSLTVSNFWRLFALTKYCGGLSEITKDISNMILSNYWEITKSNEFLEITEADMRVFLSNDDIVSSEAQMLESLMRWYKYSKQQREKSFKSLLHLIHMPSIPDLYLKFLAEKEGVDELRSCTGHRLKAEVPLDDIKRTAHFYNLALFGITEKSTSYIWYWLPFGGPWSFITSVQCPSRFRSNHTGGALYLHEYTHEQVQLSFLSNPLSYKHFSTMVPGMSFTELTERVPTSTEDSVTVALSGYVYLLGGNTRDEIIRTVQRYNTKTRSWECVSSMQERRYRHFAVSYKDRYIYAFGGLDSMADRYCTYKSTVERYDPEKNCWSFVASMRHPRCDSLAYVLTDKIFVIGGESAGGAACEIYDPLTDEWQFGRFEFNRAYTIKPLGLKELNDAGTFRKAMFRKGGANEDSSDVNLTSESEESDPIGLKKMHLPHDEKCYDHGCLSSPCLTYCNGVIIVFNFGAFWNRYLVKLPFYFVDPETGNFRILYSLPSWPGTSWHGIVMPLSRKDMIEALKDYPGNK